ncbi:MAG: sugar phosphate isomerase/epimerase [Opitutus sp.]|nr:sugar phosphate isomerase/epimerase [Opitutus sp.]
MTTYSRAFSTLGCPELSLDDALALAQSHGLAAIELRTLSGTIDLPALFAREFVTPAALAVHVARQSVQIVSLDTSFKLAEPSEAEWEAFLAFVPWAEARGVKWLRVFDGGAPGRPLEPLLATLARWRAHRASNGIGADMMIETHDSLFTAAAINAFAQAASGAAILWDTHHTWKKGGEDPVATWNAIKPHVVHVHVKDSISRPSARHPFTYVLPGAGEFPMAPLRAALAGEFRGTVSLEWERQWHPYLPPLEDALRAGAERKWW